MPITGLVDYKKPLHRSEDSGELDVFEAARYYNDNFALSQKVIKEERQGHLRGGRVSLDMPNLRHHHHLFHQFNHPIAPQKQLEKQHNHKIKDKKQKQPSSPGGKLAHFLNSLFSQTSSKKKKSSSKSSTQSMKDEDDSPNGRRKRRSSISHFNFRSTSSAIDATSIYSSSSSGFRTPPPYNLNKPSKCYKDLNDHKQASATFSKHNGHGVSSKQRIMNRGNDERSEKGSKLDWFDEKFKFARGLGKKTKDFNQARQERKREIFKNFKEELNDGADSDSSSDLFELQIDYGFGFCSSGLPVYETTHMDTIKRSSTTPITTVPSKIDLH